MNEIIAMIILIVLLVLPTLGYLGQLCIDREQQREILRLKKENAALHHTLKERLKMQEISLNAYRAAAQNLQATMEMPVEAEYEREEEV